MILKHRKITHTIDNVIILTGGRHEDDQTLPVLYDDLSLTFQSLSVRLNLSLESRLSL